MKVFGVEILNEGWGTSVDDSVNEMQATFVARLVEPWFLGGPSGVRARQRPLGMKCLPDPSKKRGLWAK
jgi:hypothetical protein